MEPGRAQSSWRPSARPWTVAGLAVVTGCAAVALAGLGVHGAVLHAVGWPLLVLLLLLLFAGAGSWGWSQGSRRRGWPAAISGFAFFFGMQPLLGALLFGPGPGLGEAALYGGFFAVWMTGFFALWAWWGRRRGWPGYTPPKRPVRSTDTDPA